MRRSASAAACLAGLLGLASGNFISPGLGKCMDIKAELKKDGKRETVDDMKDKTDPINVQLYTCHGKPNQEFEIVGGMMKSAQLKGWCLTAEKNEPNANVQLEKCDKDKLQQWDLTAENYAKLNDGDKTLCVDVLAEKKKNGKREVWDEIKKHKTVNVQLYTCHDPDTKRVNQLWSWAAVKKGKIMRLFQTEGAAIQDSAPRTLGWMAGPIFAGGLFVVGLFVGRRASRQVSVADADMEMLADQ